MRNRAWRREQTKRVQARRLRDLRATCWKTINKSQHIGHLKKDHYGCGCAHCKPHKYGFAPVLRIRDQKAMLDNDE